MAGGPWESGQVDKWGGGGGGDQVGADDTLGEQVERRCSFVFP